MIHRPLYLCAISTTLLACLTPARAAAPKLDERDERILKLERKVAELAAMVADRVGDRGAKSPGKDKPGKKAAGGSAGGQGASTAAADPDSVKKELQSLDKLLKTPATLAQISDGFAVPDSPAAAALGLPQKDVQHLDTPKQLIASAINGVDEHGNFQTGVSVDFAPMQLLWADRQVSWFRYGQERDPWGDAATWLRRVLVRTQLSFASTKGTTDADKSNKIALGLHTVLVNGNDALSNAPAEVSDPSDPEAWVTDASDGLALDARGRRLNEWVIGWRDKAMGDRFMKTQGLWQSVVEFFYSQTSWTMGAAPHWIARDGGDSYEYAGATYWSSFAVLPSRDFPARFLLNVLYQQGEEIPGKEAFDAPAPVAAGMMAAARPATISQDSLYLVGGVQVGNADFNVTLAGAYVQYDQNEFGSRNEYRYTASLEKRLSSNSWLTLGVSRSEPTDDGDSETLVLGGVKLGLGARDFRTESQQTRARQLRFQ